MTFCQLLFTVVRRNITGCQGGIHAASILNENDQDQFNEEFFFVLLNVQLSTGRADLVNQNCINEGRVFISGTATIGWASQNF